MHFHLKKNYSHLKMFLIVSLLVGITLCILQIVGSFTPIDTLLLSLGDETNKVPLPIGVILLVIMFHTIIPGIIILEEGIVKGIIYTLVIWFFYSVLIHSYTTSFHYYIPLVAPLLGCILSIIRVLLWEYAQLSEEKDDIKKTFGSFVEPRIADILLNNPNLVKQDGVSKTVTIMFADLRGFTKLCEEIAPDQVITMLRDCFGKLISIARANGGTVDKLIGDCMMVVWGNPVPVENHQEKAVESAIAMQAVMKAVSTKWQNTLGVDIKLGIGVNSDEVVAGTIGSEEFSDYTVLGSGVNLASRLESVCPGGEICVSRRIATTLNGVYEFEKLGNLKQKNTDEMLEVFRVVI